MGDSSNSECSDIVDDNNEKKVKKSSKDKKKKPKKFVPHKCPRYLLGSVPIQLLESDLKSYNSHLQRVFNSVPLIDNDPPHCPVANLLRVDLTRDATDRVQCILRENKQIVKHIAYINSTKGMVDSFNYHYKRNKVSLWSRKEAVIRKLNEDNCELYKKIKNVQAKYPRDYYEVEWKFMLKKLRDNAKYPLVIGVKPSTDEKLKNGPSITAINAEDYVTPSPQIILERPIIFMEFKMKDNINIIGTILFQLYNDVCPKTVENFLAICEGNNSKNITYLKCPLHKIYPDKYSLMGDVTKFNGKGGTSIYDEDFQIENFNLLHSRAGVLSMIPKKNNLCNSQFCLSFTALPHFNGKYVVFGKSIRGGQFLRKISDYGTITGRPSSPVYISNCGIYIKPKRKLQKQIMKNFIKKNIIACRTINTN